jgi:hypothetical protein
MGTGVDQLPRPSDRQADAGQEHKRAAWLEARLERLLPVEHFHVVFTLPVALHPLVLHHPRRLYDLLFQAASQTLLTLANLLVLEEQLRRTVLSASRYDAI